MKPKHLVAAFVILVGFLIFAPDSHAQTATPTPPPATSTPTATPTATATNSPTPTPTATATATATPTATPTCAITTVPTGNGMTGQYVCCPTQVSSATTPVTVLPSHAMSGWFLKERLVPAAATSPSTENVLVFPYRFVLPTQTPSNTTECSPGGPCVSDSTACDSPQCLNAIGEAWGAFLESGSTAVTIDACMK